MRTSPAVSCQDHEMAKTSEKQAHPENARQRVPLSGLPSSLARHLGNGAQVRKGDALADVTLFGDNTGEKQDERNAFHTSIRLLVGEQRPLRS